MKSLSLVLLACILPGAAWAQVAGGIPLDPTQLIVPPGFQISVYAQMPSTPRNIVFTPSGTLLVALMFDGKIAAVTPDGRISTFVDGLYNPTGMAMLGNDLYVAEMTQVRVYRNLDPAQSQIVIPNLPNGDHFTRTIIFGPDGKLYLGIGSDCNLCIEMTPRRAEIMRFNPDGSGEQVVATGLRNPVGLRFNPNTKQLWSTDVQFDHMGDDLPPEKLEIIRLGGNYGWPYCYGERIPNPMFPPTWSPTGDPNYCASTIPPATTFQAHSTPLGLEFYTAAMFPPQYRGDAFVTFHGSYDRTVPTGYKVVRVRVQNGLPVAAEDFATGWLEGMNASGRPVDIITGPDGALYVSDDRANVIYRISYKGAAVNSSGVVNAASAAAPAAAPGSILSIFGNDLYSAFFTADSTPLPTGIVGLSVTIGGQAAPLFYASPTQINVQVPAGVTGRVDIVLATAHGVVSLPIDVSPAAPGLFVQGSDGTGLIYNYSRSQMVTGTTPAGASDFLQILATGLGALTEPIPDGAPAPSGHDVSTVASPRVTIGGIAADVVFSGAVPGTVGVYQIVVRVPEGATGGASLPLVATMSGQTSNTVLLPVE